MPVSPVFKYLKTDSYDHPFDRISRLDSTITIRGLLLISRFLSIKYGILCSLNKAPIIFS